MTQRNKVKGTDVFLYWAVGLLILGLWAAKDGWFPSQSVIDRKTAEELRRFQLFNKSLAVICLPAAAVCAYIHRVVR